MKIDMNQIIKISIWVLVGLIVIYIIYSIIKAKKNSKKEPPASILDIDIDGVLDDRTFEFGFEKEDTIVMEQVKEEKPKKKTSEKKATKKSTTTKTTTKKETKKK